MEYNVQTPPPLSSPGAMEREKRRQSSPPLYVSYLLLLALLSGSTRLLRFISFDCFCEHTSLRRLCSHCICFQCLLVSNVEIDKLCGQLSWNAKVSINKNNDCCIGVPSHKFEEPQDEQHNLKESPKVNWCCASASLPNFP